jgi:hypothetical protein
MLHRHNSTNGPKGVHEQQAFAESVLFVRVRSLFPGSQSAPKPTFTPRNCVEVENVSHLGHSWAFSVAED